jgi:CheY-like chemotaxis protein
MSTRPWRVLVADDDADMRNLIATILRGDTYEVTLCGDAESALVRARDEKAFDVIICDFMLPGISGLELVQMLRAHPRTAWTPIVMISAHTNYGMGDRAMAAGANVFLNKPFSLSHLRTTLNGLVQGKGANALSG